MILSSECLGHAPDSDVQRRKNMRGLQHILRLAGQLRKQLHGFKAKTRAHRDGNMTAAVQALSERELDILRATCRD